MNSIKVQRDYELNEDGVTSGWAWSCEDCPDLQGFSLFWENAVRGANWHVSYHKSKVGD